jgi:glutamine synthetase
LCGLVGIDRNLDPGPSADTPYDVDAPGLPKSLREAVFALSEDAFLKEAMGETFIRYYTHIKNAEIDRFQTEVTDWEQREYFEMF